MSHLRFRQRALVGLALSMGAGTWFACSSDPVATPGPTADGGADVVEPVDAAADVSRDATNDVTPDSAPARKRLFTLLKTPGITGDIKTAGGKADSLASGDSLCTSAAIAAGLGGTWKAWLSTAATSAYSRLDDVSPWYLVDNKTIAFPTKASLKGPANVADDKWLTQDGHANGLFGLRLWTGTNSDGGGSPATCNDWTTASNAVSGGCGTTVSSNWSASPSSPCTCDLSGGLFCFEQ
jgi:hypothetical protein